MYKNIAIIAEVKTQSPFGWKSNKSWDELFVIAHGCGDILSIHTDPRWGGSFELIRKAKSLTDKPILAKGIHATDAEIVQAFESGADYCLVVGRMPGADIITAHRKKCLLEPLTLAELAHIPPDMNIVWNSRDVSDGSLKKETFAEARKLHTGWLCQASNIVTVADIKDGADAVLVGTHLEEFAESLQLNM